MQRWLLLGPLRLAQSVWLALFWKELFESGQLHSTFDWVPHCLKDRSFGRLFAQQIDANLTTVRTGGVLPVLLRTVTARWGRPNGVFAWDHVEVEALRALLTGTDPNAIASILQSMCKDYQAARDGLFDYEEPPDAHYQYRNRVTDLGELVHQTTLD
jgi:DNA polymerase III subunit epsilon